MAINQQIGELLNLRVRLRRDLVFGSRTDREGRQTVVIEDPVRDKFYRVGPREFAFLRQLNESSTVREVVQRSAANEASAVTEREAEAICGWLVDKGLAECRADRSAGSDHGWRAAMRNPLIFKVPLINPDRFLQRIEKYVGWCFGRFGLLLWTSVVLVALIALASQGARFGEQSMTVLAPGNWWWLAVCWCMLKVCHEVAHGVVCRRYGGHVSEAGFLFIVLTPLAFVDLTSAWRFRSKWHRIHTAVAGVYAEVLIAALAALIWCGTSVGVLHQLAFNTVVMAGITTVVFNANPLMRFDGYYVLTDLVDVPNLYGRSTAWWHSVLARVLLGKGRDVPLERPLIQRVYAVSAWLWRLLVTVSMILAASVLVDGLGVVLAVAASVALLAPPLWRLAQFLQRSSIGRVRLTLSTVTLALVAVAAFTWIPWVGTKSAPAVVDDVDFKVVRAAGDGFVRKIHCTVGQRVHRGDLLLELSNDTYAAQVRELEIQIEQRKLVARQARMSGKLAVYQAEREVLVTLGKRLRERQEQLNELRVFAPCDGMVMGRTLPNRLGEFVREGDELLSVGPRQGREVVVSIDQDDAFSFARTAKGQVSVWLASGRRIRGVVLDMEPNADRQVRQPALIAPYGGELAVIDRGDQNRPCEEGPRLVLVNPRVEARVALAEPAPLGQRAVVRLRAWDETFGSHIVRCSRHWLRQRLKQLGA